MDEYGMEMHGRRYNNTANAKPLTPLTPRDATPRHASFAVGDAAGAGTVAWGGAQTSTVRWWRRCMEHGQRSASL